MARILEENAQPAHAAIAALGPAPEAHPHEKEAAHAPKPPMRQDIRVDLTKLDALVNLVGELVIAEAMVTRHPALKAFEDEGLERAVHQLRRVSADLQDVAMAVRMIPLSATFLKLIRLVHDLSNKVGKLVQLELVGEETEVDKSLIEQLSDPLVHIVRNSIDHGLEMPEERRAKGKPEVGTITIEARHEGGEVLIIISDDGRGLDRAKILAKAVERGLVAASEAEKLTEGQINKLIFEPGFSTAAKVTDISGRGVGMDVVKKNLDKVKGTVEIRSRPEMGTTIVLHIPLTLAIIDGMLVRVGNARYTLPLLSIRESFRPLPEQITVTPDGQEVARVRREMLPVVRLHELYAKAPDHEKLEEGILVIVESGAQTVCLFVDELLGQQQAVIKGLSEYLGQTRGVSGCTILGDGEVSLILDVAGLIAMASPSAALN
jgi:two-component system chemotaxis sensor kinase CheA